VTVDAQIAELLSAMRTAGVPPMHHGTAQQGRAAYRERQLGSRRPEDLVPVGVVEDIRVDGAETERAARIYRPAQPGPHPTILFLHGGGWVIGDLDTHDPIARMLCSTARSVVVSLDYRLAPESPYPAAVQDALAAADFVRSNLVGFGNEATFGVAGDSAGATLAAVVAARRRGAPGVPIRAQMLGYPVTDAGGDYPSRIENAVGFPVELETMEWFWNNYAPDEECRHQPDASPILEPDLTGMPPTVLATAEYDVLRDEGAAYAKRLESCGVPVHYLCWPGLIHGFFGLTAASQAAHRAAVETFGVFGELLRGWSL
jgi:acetyl esterase